LQIYGIGTDIVKCLRIEKIWLEYGQNFAARILTAYELKAFSELKNNQVAFLAKRFAAKEAVAKALGTGFRDHVLLTQVGIETDSLGKPQVAFYGSSQDYIKTLGALSIHISIADEEDYVVAFVVISQQ
jgi:holo-[acyl-carrier protein] synthase